MHTVKVLSAGVGLLALCSLLGYCIDGRRGAERGIVVFIPLWLGGTGLNLYAGVARAGYTIREELPVAAGVFAGPALAAAGLWRMLHTT